MEQNDRQVNESDIKSSNNSSKGWTAIQHSSGLIAAIGLFVAIPAYLENSESRLLLIGLWITFAGLVGFFTAWCARRKKRSNAHRN